LTVIEDLTNSHLASSGYGNLFPPPYLLLN